MTSDTLLEDRTVLVEDGRIAAVGARGATPVPAGARVIEGSGRILMPGLADMHVHLDDEGDLRRYIEAGVTLVRNMRGEPRHLRWRDEIAAGRRLGPRIVTVGPTLTGGMRVNPRHVWIINGAEASAEVRAQAEAGYDLVKVHSGFSAELLARVRAVAESTGRAMVGHLMGGGIGAALAARQASIEHVDADDWAPDVLDQSMARIGRFRVYLCPTLTAFYDMGPAPDGGPPAHHRALIASARRHGVTILAGTDASLPPQRPGASLVAELEYLAAAGLTGYEALRTATVNAGDFLRRHVPGAARVGTVEVGGAADLILLPADPRQDLQALSSVEGVMLAGRWVALAPAKGSAPRRPR